MTGCGAWSIPSTSTSPKVTRAYRFVPNSQSCPWDVQKAIAAHNSVHESNIMGKDVIYKPKAPPVPIEKKTS
jgi:hypothetical protein